MATILPFKALRPAKDKAASVSAPSYDSGSRDKSYEELEKNPHSYLHVVKPYLHYKGERKQPEKHFPLGLRYLEQFIKEGWLLRDTQDAYYIYRLIKGSTAYTGIIAAASVADYLENRILKHEKTLTEKQQEVAEHITWFNQLGNPVLLTYPDSQPIDQLIDHYIQHHIPEYNFISSDQIKHNLWVVNQADDINLIAREFESIDKLYIADGHHRSAGAATYAQEAGSTHPAAHFFPVCLIPFSKLDIYEYHRLVKDAFVYDPHFMEHIGEYFDITPSGNVPVQPLQPKEFGLYFNHHAYLLTLKPSVKEKLVHPLEQLDVSIVEEFILKRIFEITDSKTDKRISFMDGTKGIGTLQHVIDQKDFDLGITLYKTSVQEITRIADLNEIMPPKSTWIEPKLRTGLVIYETK